MADENNYADCIEEGPRTIRSALRRSIVKPKLKILRRQIRRKKAKANKESQ